ncbi:MAG: hypothetical protein R3Y24_14330 [Eubacteriales bacterium]
MIVEVREERKQRSTVMLFISFDLVNCTLYKSMYKGNWVSGVSNVLEHIMHVFVNSKVGGYRFWKMLGDEVVYTRKIEKVEEIDEVVAAVYDTVVDINHKIKSGQIGDSSTAEILAVKATVWIADISPAELCADNIYVEYEINKNELRAEYLGTDIDSGFRIAQYTSENRVVISSDLAALFLKEESLRKDFHKINFVGFRNLKGIWHGDPYPIFMYHGDETVSFRDSIVDTSNPKAAILKEYVEQLPYRAVVDSYISYEEQLLTTLYNEDSLSREIEQLTGIMEKFKEKNIH